MSSRLNPRDYDLGELRDAVREIAESDKQWRPETQQPQPDDDVCGNIQGPKDTDNRLKSTGSQSQVPIESGRHDGYGQPGRSHRSGRQQPPEQQRITPEERDGHRRRTAQARWDSSSNCRGPSQRADELSDGDLELLSHLSQRTAERPYLGRLPDEYSAQLEIFDWLEALLTKSGQEGTRDAIDYYESIGWLSKECGKQLEGFLEGLTAADPPDPRPLKPQDHRQSLLYIARLSHRLYR